MAASYAIEIESADVIKLIQQFLKENNLLNSLNALQAETKVTLNTVDDKDRFTADILHGRWGNVLSTLSTCSLPDEKQEDLFEQVIVELLELGEMETCNELLDSKPLQKMKLNNTNRFARLKNLSSKRYFDHREAYPVGTNKEKRRSELADSLRREVQTVPSSRLLSLLNHSIKWQQHLGVLPKGDRLDLFRGDKPLQRDRQEKVAEKNSKVIKFGKTSCANSAAFSPDGQFLVTGSSDGFIEVWDFDTGKLRKDLKYQAEDELMLHEDAVQCLSFSRDSELIVSGSKDGKIKIWRLFTGDCVVRFDSAHTEGVTSVSFKGDGSQVLSSSLDRSVRIHGIRSGRQLKQFTGHESYVHKAIYSQDNSHIISCSTDGTVKVWNVKSADCVHSFVPTTSPGRDLTVHNICLNPSAADEMFICTESSQIFCTKLDGSMVRTYTPQLRRDQQSNFINLVLSARGQFLYAVTDTSVLYVFDIGTGDVVHVARVHAGEVLGLAHHPHRNILTTYSSDRTLRIWRV